MNNFVYVLRCTDGSLYTGMAADWKKRINRHYRRLTGCSKYMRSHEIESIAAVWEAESETAARRLEARFKLLKRERKLLLITEPEKVPEFIPALEEYRYAPVFGARLSDCI